MSRTNFNNFLNFLCCINSPVNFIEKPQFKMRLFLERKRKILIHPWLSYRLKGFKPFLVCKNLWATLWKKMRPFLHYRSLELFIFGFDPIFVFSDPAEDYFALSVLSRVFLFLPSSCTSQSGSAIHVMTSSQLIDKLGARRKSSNLK